MVSCFLLSTNMTKNTRVCICVHVHVDRVKVVNENESTRGLYIIMMYTQSSNTQQVFASFMRFLPCVQNNDADKVKLEIVPNDKR